jgi:ketosteroid isomerase-like protein
MLMQQFLRTFSLTVALGAMSAATACDRDSDNGDKHREHIATTISDADAAKVTDATVAAWQSMDAAKIDALYAPNVAGFDPAAPDLSTDRANWTKLQQGFAAMKFDHVAVKQSKTQILDAEDFIFSSVSNLTSTDGSVKSMSLRCTDVFRKQSDGRFLIVNEHCSTVPGATV